MFNGSPAPEETTAFKVFAGNLAYSTTDEGLKAFFAPVQNEVLSAQVIMRGGTRSAGYGFVSLTTAEAAQQAVDLLDKKELDGRTLIIEVAKLAEANGKASADAAKAEGASPASDEATKPKKKKKARQFKRKTESKAPATEAAPSAEGATDAAAAKKPKPRTPRTPRPSGEDPLGEPSKTVLFVANLGFNIDDAGLSALFTDAGIAVNSARIVRRRWGKPRKSKGYGFVDVGDEEQQQKAIEALQGKEVGGRAIAVKIAVNPLNDGDASEDGDAEAEEKETAVEVAPVESISSTSDEPSPNNVTSECYRFGDDYRSEHVAEVQSEKRDRAKKGAKRDNHASGRKNASRKYIAEFFAMYPAYPYNPLRSFMEQFYDMCDFFQWDKESNERDTARKRLQDAMVLQFNTSYGFAVDDVHAWQTMCRALEIYPVPDTLEECREAVLRVHVNICDLVEALTLGKPRIFPTEYALSVYSRVTGKIFPRSNVHAGSLLRFLLRRIFHPPPPESL